MSEIKGAEDDKSPNTGKKHIMDIAVETDLDFDSGEYDEYSDAANEEEEDKIQQIIGIKNVEINKQDSEEEDYIDLNDVPDKDLLFYVKWVKKSHIHDSFMSNIEVLETPGGENALKKFKINSSDGLMVCSSNKDIEYILRWY